MTLSDNITRDLTAALQTTEPDNVIVVTDTNTDSLCLPAILDTLSGYCHSKIVIPAGDDNKDLEQLQRIWTHLQSVKATRHSLMICLGGGMITDIGGFAASTYMRGMPYINIPTTLLATVDAATGGKTGINYRGMKNQIGVFASPATTIIYPPFFNTLPFSERLSGYAEMVKHALLADAETLRDTLRFDLDTFDTDTLSLLITENLRIKNDIVASDPEEHGIRQALNLGHTIGHALESLSHLTDRPLPHGYAVMWGLVAELYISMITVGLDKSIVSQINSFARDNYPPLPISCRQYDRLFDFMRHDKKNHHGTIRFTLLEQIGKPVINQTPNHDTILEALDFI